MDNLELVPFGYYCLSPMVTLDDCPVALYRYFKILQTQSLYDSVHGHPVEKFFYFAIDRNLHAAHTPRGFRL